MRRFLAVVPIALVLLTTACGTEAGGPVGGTVIIGAAADADALVPPVTGTVQGRAASELMFDRLADIGADLNLDGDAGYEPRLAKRWDWSRDSLTLTFHLDPAARWHDGRPVRSADAVAGYRITRDPANGSSLATHFADIDSISVQDSLTFSLHYARRNAEQFYAATWLFPLPAHLVDSIPSGEYRRSAFASAPVGSGRFRFVSWEPKVRLELAATDDHYRGRPKLDRVVFTVTTEPAAGLARVWAGDTDIWEPLTPADMPEASKHEHVRVVSGPGFDYGFLAFNFRDAKDPRKPHPIFADREVRRALTMAIDRATLLKATFDTLAVLSNGPFTRPQSAGDTSVTQIPFDREAAAAKLDSLGWRRGADGIRAKGRQRLSFGVHVPTSSAVRNRYAVLMQEQFRQVGVEMNIVAMEFGAMRAETDAGRFDAVIGGWRTNPSPSGIRGSWGSPAIARGARQNSGSYHSPDFDAAVEAGLSAADPKERRRYLHNAYQIAVDDAAAIWLYEARNFAAVHKRLNVPRWRSESWWINLADWTVDPSQRLPRDTRPATP